MKKSIFTSLILVAALSFLGACSKSSENQDVGSALGASPSVNGISLTLGATNIAPNASTTIQVTGGFPPYFITSLGGTTIGYVSSTATLGLYSYRASSTQGSETLQVQDAYGNVQTISIQVSTSGTSGGGGLSITPGITVSSGNTYQLSPTGGTPPYKFTWVAGVGGNPNYGGTAGLYSAPYIYGSNQTDTIAIQDSSSPVKTVTVQITITAGSIPGGGSSQMTIYQLYNSSKQDYLYGTDPSEGTSAGYRLEGPVFTIYSPQSTISGLVPLYRCRTRGAQKHFLSSSSYCDGQFADSDDLVSPNLLGYISYNAVNGFNQPLYQADGANGSKYLVLGGYGSGATFLGGYVKP